uniref:Uncharacterized protein n=1 Tax=Anguilla anguilla TaxID=7936 RepID=A0A0E9RCT5_ANGAN
MGPAYQVQLTLSGIQSFADLGFCIYGWNGAPLQTMRLSLKCHLSLAMTGHFLYMAPQVILAQQGQSDGWLRLFSENAPSSLAGGHSEVLSVSGFHANFCSELSHSVKLFT